MGDLISVGDLEPCRNPAYIQPPREIHPHTHIKAPRDRDTQTHIQATKKSHSHTVRPSDIPKHRDIDTLMEQFGDRPT